MSAATNRDQSLTTSKISAVQSFNRLVARQVGALDDRYMGHRRSAVARAVRDRPPRRHAARHPSALGLDSGYLAPLLRALPARRARRRGARPGRPQDEAADVTAAGRGEMAELDRISDELAAATLAPLDPGAARPPAARAGGVRRLLAISMVEIGPEDSGSADARWCLGHCFAELAERFEEPFDPTRTLPTGARDLFLLARFSGQPAAQRAQGA